MSNETNDNRKKKRTIIIAAIIALLLAVIGVLLYLLLSKEDEVVSIREPLVPMGGRGAVLTPENAGEIENSLNISEPIEDGQYTVSMSTNWEFETARTPSRNAIVNNLDVNKRTVCFDVYIRDPWEVVYCSPYMPLGSTNAGFALDKDLAPGVYDAVVIFFLLDDNYEPITNVSISVTITINN